MLCSVFLTKEIDRFLEEKQYDRVLEIFSFMPEPLPQL
jgi:hypothetical protein